MSMGSSKRSGGPGGDALLAGGASEDSPHRLLKGDAAPFVPEESGTTPAGEPGSTVLLGRNAEFGAATRSPADIFGTGAGGLISSGQPGADGRFAKGTPMSEIWTGDSINRFPKEVRDKKIGDTYLLWGGIPQEVGDQFQPGVYTGPSGPGLTPVWKEGKWQFEGEQPLFKQVGPSTSWDAGASSANSGDGGSAF